MLCRRMNPNPLVRGRNTTLGCSLCKLLDGRHFIARGEHSNFFFHHCFHRRTARRCSSAADHRRKAIKPRFQRENRQIHANHTGSLSPAMVACVVVEGFFRCVPHILHGHASPTKWAINCTGGSGWKTGFSFPNLLLQRFAFC